MIAKSAPAFIALMALLLCALMVSVEPAEAEGSYLVLSEDFEDGLDEDWNVTDHNTDSGLDFWGTTGYREQAGSASAWCASNGTSSVNYYPNSDNRYYDQDMQAVLQTPVQDLSGFDTVTLRFHYWAETGTLSPPNDYLEVRVWNGWYWKRIWKQPDVDTGGSWEQAVAEIPLNTIWISFSFISDSVIEDVIGFGPYEGVYIDTITVYGYDSTSPTSSMNPLDEYSSSETIYIVYTATDRGGSGVSHVELYYRAHGISGVYTMYTTPEKMDGKWTEGIIPFNCSLANEVGGYDFYTLAEDNMGNREIPVNIPQTSTVIDIAAPTTTAETTGGDPLPDGWTNGIVSVEFNVADDVSGVASTFYRVDDGPWEEYDDTVEIEDDGTHTLWYYSEDNSGNLEGVKVIDIAIDSVAPTASLATPGGATTFTNSTVSFAWTSEDGLSGIDYCLFCVDDRAFEFLADPGGTVDAIQLESGSHTATLRAVDHAGNVYETVLEFEVDLGETEVEAEAEGDALGWAAAIAVVIAAIIAFMLFMKAYLKKTQ